MVVTSTGRLGQQLRNPALAATGLPLSSPPPWRDAIDAERDEPVTFEPWGTRQPACTNT